MEYRGVLVLATSRGDDEGMGQVERERPLSEAHEQRSVEAMGEAPAASPLLANLNAEQLAAVTLPAGNALILAGAGSGKTRVLTRRIAHRIEIGTADARHTLALTFTREATINPF